MFVNDKGVPLIYTLLSVLHGRQLAVLSMSDVAGPAAVPWLTIFVLRSRRILRAVLCVL